MCPPVAAAFPDEVSELTLIDTPKHKHESKPSWTQLETQLPNQDQLDQPTSTWKLYVCKKKMIVVLSQ